MALGSIFLSLGPTGARRIDLTGPGGRARAPRGLQRDMSQQFSRPLLGETTMTVGRCGVSTLDERTTTARAHSAPLLAEGAQGESLRASERACAPSSCRSARRARARMRARERFCVCVCRGAPGGARAYEGRQASCAPPGVRGRANKRLPRRVLGHILFSQDGAGSFLGARSRHASRLCARSLPACSCMCRT